MKTPFVLGLGASPPLATAWPLEFSPAVRTLIVARQRAIPGGDGYPVCYCCGEPIRWRPDIHHRKRKRKGEGDGRPSNGIAVHNRVEGEQCHFRKIHEDVDVARAYTWIIRFAAPLKAYRAPMWTAQHGWIVMNDAGDWRQATDLEVSGDYGDGP